MRTIGILIFINKKSDGKVLSPIAGYHAIIDKKKNSPGNMANGPAMTPATIASRRLVRCLNTGRITTAATELYPAYVIPPMIQPPPGCAVWRLDRICDPNFERLNAKKIAYVA